MGLKDFRQMKTHFNVKTVLSKISYPIHPIILVHTNPTNLSSDKKKEPSNLKTLLL
jgi:hypothetical protein